MSDKILSDIDEIVCETVDTVDIAPRVLAHLAERGFLVLGPDGEPIDVRPALRALGDMSASLADQDSPFIVVDGVEREGTPDELQRTCLTEFGVTGPLADVCLAAAEVEP